MIIPLVYETSEIREKCPPLCCQMCRLQLTGKLLLVLVSQIIVMEDKAKTPGQSHSRNCNLQFFLLEFYIIAKVTVDESTDQLTITTEMLSEGQGSINSRRDTIGILRFFSIPDHMPVEYKTHTAPSTLQTDKYRLMSVNRTDCLHCMRLTNSLNSFTAARTTGDGI